MNLFSIFEIIGLNADEFDIYNIDGQPYVLACEFVSWLGLSNTTQAIKGTGNTQKLSFPAWRFEYLPEVNNQRSVYLLNGDGMIQVIKKNRNATTKRLKAVLAEAGI